MLAALANPILPIFSLIALGLFMGRRGIFSADMARALNSFVFWIGQPALIYLLASRAPFAEYDLASLAVYFGSQLILYLLVAAAARCLFGAEIREALLLGMTVVFVNHLYYVLPIVEILRGDAAAAPIEGAIFVDLAVMYCGTITVMECMKRRQRLLQLPLTLGRNPALIALLLGIGGNLSDGGFFPEGVDTYAGFAGRAAAPVLLFALGVVMSRVRIFRRDGLTLFVIAANVILHPLLLWGLFQTVAVQETWSGPLLMLAAGPCGAMPFVIALQYGVGTERLSRAILISSFVTLVSLALMTGLPAA